MLILIQSLKMIGDKLLSLPEVGITSDNKTKIVLNIEKKKNTMNTLSSM